ncbi:MAG: DUF2304 domain-containing protein [Nocardioides sp.]
MKATVVLGLAGAVTILVVMFEMLRRHRLREKYAVLWCVVALSAVTVALFPGLLRAAAELVGVEVPSNLLFFVASMVLLLLSVQLSYELGRLEEKTRTLAEEVALLRLDLEEATRDAGQ